jgi:hypothetical protein
MKSNITKKDIILLTYLADYEMLTVSQLSALCDRSRQVIRRRLRVMKGEDLIDTKLPGFGRSLGRAEELFFLSNKGSEFLMDKRAISCDPAGNRSEKTNSKFIDHDLLLNWFRIHLLQIEKAIPRLHVRYLSPSSSFLPRRNGGHFSSVEGVPVNTDSKQSVEFTPDGVFSMTEKERQKTLLFFIEIDMGTESLAGPKRDLRDVRQKIINYQTYFNPSS